MFFLDPDAKSRLFNYYGGMAGFHNPTTSGITDNALHLAYSAATQGAATADHNSNSITNTVLNTGNHQVLPQVVPSGLQCAGMASAAAAANMNHQGWQAAQSVFDHMAAAQAFGNRSSAAAITQQAQGMYAANSNCKIMWAKNAFSDCLLTALVCLMNRIWFLAHSPFLETLTKELKLLALTLLFT